MTIAVLDYAPAKLSIESNNQLEQAYRICSCAKEPWTIAFIEAIPAGAVFWDVGANTGAYSMVAAHRNLTVVSIEPGFNNYAALCRNLAMNDLLDRTLTLCLALGEKTGYSWLHYQDTRAGGAHHVIGGVREKYFQKQLIPVWALDDLWPTLPLPADRPHYIKIDVDGGELLALKGATALLADVRLMGCMVEMPNDDEAAITAALLAGGLKLIERIDQREGRSIGEIAYGRFERG